MTRRDRSIRHALDKFGLQKFADHACPKCGTPQGVINGRWLRHERELAGLSLREMAQRLGYSAAFICDVEHNRRNCSPRVREAYEALR